MFGEERFPSSETRASHQRQRSGVHFDHGMQGGTPAVALLETVFVALTLNEGRRQTSDAAEAVPSIPRASIGGTGNSDVSSEGQLGATRRR